MYTRIAYLRGVIRGGYSTGAIFGVGEGAQSATSRMLALAMKCVYNVFNIAIVYDVGRHRRL